MDALQRGVVALEFLAACDAVDAFGAKTHLWIGKQILGDPGAPGRCPNATAP
jgi:hypothetical protein